MSQKSIIFNGTRHSIPKNFNYKQFSKEKMEDFIKSDNCVVENHSGISYDIFNSFFSYLCDQTRLPIVTESNIFGLRILCEEFGIDIRLIPNLDDENIYRVYCLKYIESSDYGSKSNIERYITTNLDNFIENENYSNELIKVPITSLYNIFYHKDRIVDHEKAYQFIIKHGNENNQLFSLLNSIDATKLSPKQIEDSLINLKNHFYHIPNNLDEFFKLFFERLNRIELIEQAEKKCEKLKEDIKSGDIKEIKLPEFLTRIPNDLFEKCNNIVKIIIPDSVLSIGGKAFSECSSLSDIKIPNSIKIIGDYSFYGCISITNIDIPNSTTVIGDHAFDGCKSLVQISIPDTITLIGENAFHDCSSLKLFEVPPKITLIRYSTFNNCSSLEKIIIPKTVKSIESYAFCSCSSLKEIDISNVSFIGSSAFSGCSSLEKIEIPDGIDILKNHVFAYCSKLTEVKIPESVVTLEDCVFYQCFDLESITLSSVKIIKSYAFSYCKSLKQIDIKNTTIIERYAFSNCSSLEKVDIPQSVELIKEGVFISCGNLTEIKITNSTSKFVKYFCHDCEKLRKIIAPNACVNGLINAGVNKEIIEVKGN